MTFNRNVFPRGRAGYEHVRRASAFSGRVPDRYPEFIVVCRDVSDVIAGVGIAIEAGLQLAVRSGGHHWNANHLREGTVLLDMHGMCDCAVDLESDTAWAQPGLRGSDLNLALLEVGRFFPVGHCTDVCIGGFLLQGGIAWDNHRYGPACGHVYAIDVVTADGQLVHATDDNEHSSLLWAARGAGAGFFGVIVKYYIRLYPRRLAVNSTYLFPVDALEEVYGFAQQIGPYTPTEINMLTFRDPAVNPDSPLIAMNAMAHADSFEQAVEQLAILETNPALPAAFFRRTNEVTSLAQTSAQGADLHYMEDHRYVGDCIWTHESIDALGPIFRRIAESLTGNSHIMFTNFGSDTPPPRAPMCFSNDDLYYYGVYAVWEDSAQDQEKIDWLVGYMTELAAFATGSALADENLANRSSRFMSDESFIALQHVRDTYDPFGRFVGYANGGMAAVLPT